MDNESSNLTQINKSEKSESFNTIDLNIFINDLKEMFDNCYNGVLSGEENSNYQFVEKFKSKYEKLKLNTCLLKTCDRFEERIINEFNEYHLNCKKSNMIESYYCTILELYEFLIKLYIIDNLKFKLPNKTEKVDQMDNNSCLKVEDLIKLFKKIGNDSENYNIDKNLNHFIDHLIENLIYNNEPKILFVSNNLLTYFKNINTFLSIKIIILNLIILSRLNNNYKFINTSISNIINILMPESNLFSRKMNLELYGNQFEDFDFSVNDSNNRKLSSSEFKFLINDFFQLLILILRILTSDNKNIMNISNRNSRVILFKLIENSLEEGKVKIETEDEIKIYKTYITICFISDIIEFIFSNLHYVDENFKNEERLDLDFNPFLVFKNNKELIPLNYDSFLNKVNEIIFETSPNIINLIEIFLKISDIRSINQETIKSIEKEDDNIYLLFEPFNVVGFSVICWINFKKFKNYPCVYSNLHLFDCMLPICSSLIKIAQNFKFIGLEMLFNLINENLNEEIISDLRILKNYSFDDVFKDLLDFIGGPDPEPKRIYISKNIIKFVKLLSRGARKQFYNNLLKDILKINSNINDAQVSFILYTLKSLLTEDIKNGIFFDNPLFEESFIKDIIDLTINEKLFVIDIIETISQGLNFAHFMIMQDKLIFNKRLKLYEKNYLYSLENKITIISNLINKWVRSTDEDKMKQVSIDTTQLDFTNNISRQKEDLKKSFELRKNQALICLNMVNNVENLIRNYLNLLSKE